MIVANPDLVVTRFRVRGNRDGDQRDENTVRESWDHSYGHGLGRWSVQGAVKR